MFNFINIELFPITVGAEVSGVVLTGEGASSEPYRDGRATPSDLPVPWRDLQPNPNVFSLLQWRTSISEFQGREFEMDALHRWAVSAVPISAKFVTGEGGVGKTRLAAELAMTLRKDGWAAGFPELRKPNAYFANRNGTLLIIDYPEEHPGELEAMFAGLARLEQDHSSHLRVLFLSRRDAEDWRQLALDSNADAMFDWTPVHLGPLEGEGAYSVFHSALERAAEAEDTVPPPVSMEAFQAWLKHAPENDRALFIVATAVHCALHPQTLIIDYKGRDVVSGLVERETSRLRRIARGAGLPQDSLNRLLAFAAISDGLGRDAIESVASKTLQLSLSDPADISEKLEQTGWLVDGGVPALKPDIIAAAFVVMILGRVPTKAPEWLWAAISDDVSGGLERLGRLSHDSEVVLALHEHRVSNWLVSAFEGRPDRCVQAVKVATEVTLPLGLMPLDVAVWQTLADVAENDEQKGESLHNLSVARASVGDTPAALEAVRAAVAIYRRLAAASPTPYEPRLATCLNSLSNRLADVGDTPAALEAISEAVDIQSRLAAVCPVRHEPDLAKTLNNLSSCLSEEGDTPAALNASRDAVEVFRRLAAENPARYEPELSASLNNLSAYLSAVDDALAASEASREAVKLQRRLAAASPARHEAALALSLNNFSNRLSHAGDTTEALKTIREAVELHRKLSTASPKRFEPDLAMSLSVLSDRLEEDGQTDAAIEATEEAIHLMRPYAERYPESEHGRRYNVMQNDLARLIDSGNRGVSDEPK